MKTAIQIQADAINTNSCVTVLACTKLPAMMAIAAQKGNCSIRNLVLARQSEAHADCAVPPPSTNERYLTERAPVAGMLSS